MHILKRQVVAPFTTQQMFALINDIVAYPQFLPWCSSSKIISAQDNEIIATLNISWQGFTKSFTTRNILVPYHSVNIFLVSGPLRHLQGSWQLRDLGANNCEVKLDLSFEFMGHMVDFLFEPVFKYIANSLVTAFSERAQAIYTQ
jgi:ribosome-associated toxin RatA of RatAB toxin-antitoxin module